MSHEKRVLEFVDAVGESGIDADVLLHGAGLLLPRVRDRIARLGIGDRVTVAGPVPYRDALAAMRDADALVQTSMGFETQGLTPFEAAVLGTPTVFCDPEIADDVAVSAGWRVPDGSVSALARTLQEAVAAIAEDPAAHRVPESEARGFLQSAQIEVLLDVYERVVAAA
jgi:glycosyltransferase involved in cell wall biosynthesis